MATTDLLDDYMVDNNVISILIRGKNDPDYASNDPLHKKVYERFSMLGNSRIFIPAIAIAEIKFGFAITDNSTLNAKAVSSRKLLDEFFKKYSCYGFDKHSIATYVLSRSKLWMKHAKPKKNGRGGFDDKIPEELFDNQTGQHLGIDEKDLLIFSCAIEHNLIFATCDTGIGMRRIIEAAHELKSEGKLDDVREEDWTS